ncbi:hypothetical protein BGZ98_001582 [Dissophora globulifera]|nr:hypothetical protein BGZ98_001582 [Dissophora globulifera]
MDTSAARPISLPQLEHGGKRLPSSRPDPDDPTRTKSNGVHPHHHHHQQHHHHHHHYRPAQAQAQGNRSHSRSPTRSRSNSLTAAESRDHDSDSPIHSPESGSGLSLREQQQLRNQAAINAKSVDKSNSNSNSSLTLSITPPKVSSTYLDVEPSSRRDRDAEQHQQEEPQQQGQQQQQQQQQHQQTLLSNDAGNISSHSNNSLLGASHDSLGSSLSHSHSQSGSRSTSRRASFNLSTGSLSFNTSSTSSLASPSSPSYSTIAVARARAAAAAAAEGGQGADADAAALQHAGGGAWGGLGGITEESGVFPGAPASVAFPYSSPSTSSNVGGFPSSFSQDSHFCSRPSAQSHPHLSKSMVSSSSSSLQSNGSENSFDSNHHESGSGPGLGVTGSSSSSSMQTHLQDNVQAEREISMILDDFLYLGGELVDEEQVLELERLGIKRVLNMAVNCDDELWIQRFGKEGYLKVGLLDHVDQDLKDGLDEAIAFIESSDAPVYVHCQAGKSRSVATVIGYLIQERRWPLKKAYDHVVERRRIMSPNIGFVSQLIMLEERVLGAEKAGGLVSVGSEDTDPASRTTVVPWII